MDLYLAFKLKVKQLIQEAKSKHFEGAICRSGSDSRKMWKAIIEAIYGRQNKNFDGISTLKLSDGISTSNPIEIANSMNKFVASQY